jgi:linearmycin/streptolysin S transport system permease protein
MIWTIFKIGTLNLRRDKAAFVMTFVMPVVFFSIFALIFGAGNRGTKENKIKVVVTDLDHSEISARFIATLKKQKALDVSAAPDDATARKQVHDGSFPVAVIVLKNFSATFGNFVSDQETVEMVYDAANPIAQNAVSGLLQAAAMMSAPDTMIVKGFSNLEGLGAGLTPQQSRALENIRPYLRGDKPWSELTGVATDARDPSQGMLRIRSTDVRAGEAPAEQRSMIAYYAAGVAVMFLLFSMAGAGGALIEETETGTLERLLSTNITMTRLLAGKWVFLTVMGSIQVAVMFVWAALGFRLELFTPGRLAGVIAMAIVTAAAAAGFGLVLATACKTRAQLGGTSSVVILTMSAIGGSMVPRFVMPKFMETLGLFTFNGWALDGFLKVFWYGDVHASVIHTLRTLTPQLAMLTVLTVVLLAVARRLARRWETV